MGRDNTQKTKQRPPSRRNSSSVMKPCIVFVAVMAALPGATAIKGKIMTVVREDTARLPCSFPEQTIVQGTKVVYWQKEASPSQKVALEAHDGQKNPEYLDSQYLNRTELDSDGSSLILQHVSLQDEGTYECIVHQKPQQHLEKIHHSTLQLKVIANFSHPAIAQAPQGKLKNGTTVNLTCSSVGGYPGPRGLDWIISSRNGILKGEMQTTQDNDTKLYNVTSKLTWPFTERVNISCRILLMEDLDPLSSEILSVDLEDEQMNSSIRLRVAIAASVIVFLIVSGVAIVTVFVKKRKKRKKSSTDGADRQDVSNNVLANNRDEVGELMGNNQDTVL